MKKLSLFIAVALLLGSTTTAALADDAGQVISNTYTGEKVAFQTNVSNFELYWNYAPDAGVNTLSPTASFSPVPWAVAWDPVGGKFAIVTDLAGTPKTVVHEGTALTDITGASAAAFADFIGGGVAIYGVGQISSVTGTNSGVEKDFSTVSNPIQDIATQMTFVLAGLPISGLVAGPAGAALGSLTTVFAPTVGTAVMKFIEDTTIDFHPTEAGAGLPLTTAQLDPLTGTYTNGLNGNKAANDPADPAQSSFLEFDVPTAFTLTDQWDLLALAGLGNAVTIDGVKYYLQGAAQFIGEPFRLIGGTGAGLFEPLTKFNISGQVLFGYDPATNPQFANPDDPSTFTFVSGPGVGAHPQMAGGPVIPEPATGLLLGLGMVGVAALRRRGLIA